MFRNLMNRTAAREIVPLDTPLYRAYQAIYSHESNVLPHYHDELEILIYNGKIGSARIGGKKFRINATDVHIVPPNTVHAFHIKPDGKSSGVYVAQLRLTQLKQALSGYPGFEWVRLERSLAQLPVILHERREEMLRLIISLSFFSSRKRKNPTVETLFHDLEVVSRLIRIIVESGKQAARLKVKDERLRRILDVLENHASEPFILETIAKESALSKHHLCRLFKQGTGMTLTEYTLKSKVQKACDMLEFGRKNVSQTAESCGFQSLSYFIKSFKATTGLTPKQWVLQRPGSLKHAPF